MLPSLAWFIAYWLAVPLLRVSIVASAGVQVVFLTVLNNLVLSHDGA